VGGAGRVGVRAAAPHPPAAVAPAGGAFFAARAYAAAEPLLIENLSFREAQAADAWETHQARSLLGAALLGQKRYAEAEPHLLRGYEGMKRREDKIAAQDKVRLTDALERLVQLYDAWNKPDEAARWRTELEKAKEKP